MEPRLLGVVDVDQSVIDIYNVLEGTVASSHAVATSSPSAAITVSLVICSSSSATFSTFFKLPGSLGWLVWIEVELPGRCAVMVWLCNRGASSK